MPEDIKKLTIFIASPGDVREERNAVETVVRDLNISLCPHLGLQLVPWMWERNSTPGFGKDPQDVINSQAPDDCDIFVGILANRFGTPTKRADSGTLEEFQRAREKFDQDQDSVHLMLYFNDAPVNPSSLDLEQMQKVRDFKDSLGEQGGLYRNYDGPANFTDLFRTHLVNIVTGIGMSLRDKVSLIENGRQADQEPEDTDGSATANRFTIDDFDTIDDIDFDQVSYNIPVESPEELQTFDLIDTFLTESAVLADIMQDMTSLIEKYSENLNKRTAEVNQASLIKDTHLKMRMLKQSLLKASRLNEIFSDVSEGVTARLAEARPKAFSSLTRAIELLIRDPDLDIEGFAVAAAQLDVYERSITQSIEAASAFRATIDSTPTFSHVLTRSQGRLSESLGKTIRELELLRESGRDLRGTVQNFLK